MDDVLFGFPFGHLDLETPEAEGPRQTPHEALMDAVLPALLDQPCRVSFSGGRDSSTVLAVATKVARREGLPDPVPVTFRHSSTDSHEDEWQTIVLEHLGLTEHVTVDVEDELRFLGPVFVEAWGVLGPHWPPNAHGHLPLLRACGQGGTLLTGIDGDGLLTPRSWAAAWARSGWGRPRSLLGLTVPRAAQRVRAARAFQAHPWLDGEAAARYRRVRAAHLVHPRTEHARLNRYLRARYVQIATDTLDRLGAAEGVTTVHPLADPDVNRALAATRPVLGHPSRAAATAALAGDTLPSHVVDRPSKARFDAMYALDRNTDLLPTDSPLAALDCFAGRTLAAVLLLADPLG